MTDNATRTKGWINDRTNTNDRKMNYDNIEKTLPKTFYATTKSLTADHENVEVRHYLERQGRNEFIDPAFEIAYNGNNIAFVFMKIKFKN